MNVTVTTTLIPVVSQGECADSLDRAIDSLRARRLDTGICRFLPGGSAEWRISVAPADIHVLGEALMSAGLELTRTGHGAFQLLCACAARLAFLPRGLLVREFDIAIRVTMLSSELPVFQTGDEMALVA